MSKTKKHVLSEEEALLLKSIQQEIASFAAIINQEKDVFPSSFAGLKRHADVREGLSAHLRLVALFAAKTTLSDIKTQFRAHCEQRSDALNGTALYYNVFSGGDSNALYFSLARQLFEPANLRELLEILCPQITHEYVLEFSRVTGKQKGRRYLKKVPLTESATGNEVTPENLSNYVFFENGCFDLRTFHNITLVRKAQIYAVIARESKAFAACVFNHNPPMRELAVAIETYSQGRQTPRRAIEKLIDDLERGGERFTGKEYAADTALTACGAFNEYLEGLSADLAEKIKALKAAHDISLEMIMAQLTAEEACIETGASLFRRVLDYNRLNPVLKECQPLTKVEIERLESENGKSWRIKTADCLSMTLPEQAFKRIFINSIAHMATLLKGLPAECYPGLIQHVHLNTFIDLLFEALIHMVEADGLLSLEQRETLQNALLQHYNRFIPYGGLGTAFEIVLTKWNRRMGPGLLLQFSQEDLRYFLSKGKWKSSDILHLVSDSAKAITVVMKTVNADSRILLTASNNEACSNLLSVCANKSDTLLAVWTALPPVPQRFALLCAANSAGESAMSIAFQHDCFRALQTILLSLSVDELTSCQVIESLKASQASLRYVTLAEKTYHHCLEQQIIALKNRPCEYLHFGLFRPFGARSKTEEIEAASALLQFLRHPAEYPLNPVYHAVLKQGCLKRIVHAYASVKGLTEDALLEYASRDFVPTDVSENQYSC